MSSDPYATYEAAGPYFDLVRRGLGDLVDGAHFLYDLGGWPRVVRGRTALMRQFRGYVEAVTLYGADRLVVHRADGGRVVILEYEVHGTIVATGAAYDNRFCSVIHIDKRKIARWRDYMDSLAAWNALTAR
jgi:ketosteroid isomerase-like protein